MRQGGGSPSPLLPGLAAVLAIVVAAWVIATSPGSVSKTGVGLPAANGESVILQVEAGDSARAIGDRLAAAGMIDAAGSFELLASLTGSDRHLEAGEYEFEAGTSLLDVVTRIRGGLTAALVVTIPEGLRLEEVAARLERAGVVGAGEFLAAANALASAGAFPDPDLFADRPAAATIEGYLYPATFSFQRSVTATEVVLAMVEALGERLDPALREAARTQGLGLHEVLVLASIVEREAVLAAERPLIASVFLNRLRDGMPLQADPTVQYAITARPGSVEEFGFWKRGLSLQDLQYESTYNTYTRGGLPPGPIANPGIDSIVAVIRPATTRYRFFVARNDGSHAFAETFEEHQRNVAIFQR